MFEIKKEILETHEALLTVEMEEQTVKQAMQQAARVMSQKYNVPGFRKGKAPYAKVVQYVGEAAVRQEAADALLEEIYPQILEQAEVNPYGPGDLQAIKPVPLTFTIRVPLEPEVVLGDYLSLREEWEELTVTDDETANVLAQLREEHAILEPLERPAEFGDAIHINVVGTVDGKVIVDEDNIEVILKEDAPFIAPGFFEELVGMQTGEGKTFTIVFPEDFREESLRGAETQFDVTLVGVYERVLPDLDDALASTVGAFETLDDLKRDISTRLLEGKQNHAREHYRDDLVASLVAQSEVAYPPALLEHTLDDMLKDIGARIKREQKMSLEDALQLEGVTLEQFRKQMTPQAQADIKQSLVLSKFAEEEGLVVNDDEVVQEFNHFLASLGQSFPADREPVKVDSPLGRNLRLRVLSRKTLEHLEKIGRGEFVAAAPEDTAVETPMEPETAPAAAEEIPAQDADAPEA